MSLLVRVIVNIISVIVVRNPVLTLLSGFGRSFGCYQCRINMRDRRTDGQTHLERCEDAFKKIAGLIMHFSKSLIRNRVGLRGRFGQISSCVTKTICETKNNMPNETNQWNWSRMNGYPHQVIIHGLTFIGQMAQLSLRRMCTHCARPTGPKIFYSALQYCFCCHWLHAICLYHHSSYAS